MTFGIVASFQQKKPKITINYKNILSDIIINVINVTLTT